MKRAKNLYAAVCESENLYFAAWKAAKGKRYSREVLDFMADIDNQIRKIEIEFAENRLNLGDYKLFLIYEPKERQICAPSFHDQVIQHALMNVCHDSFEHYQISDSYASRKDKGLHTAVARAQFFTQKNQYYLKLDVKKFFDSIPHEVLKKQLYNRFKEKEILSAFYQIIDSYEKSSERGVPIGNLTSQYFANHFLAALDRFIKQNLRCKSYVRYMDDMILWENDKEKLKHYFSAINYFIENHLQCTLKPEQLNRCEKGVPFLGFRIFAKKIRLLHKSKIRFIRKIRQAHQEFLRNYLSQKEYKQRLSSLHAFIIVADDFAFRQSLQANQSSSQMLFS